ncbi:MAG: hypothetical protein ABW193_04130 [Luteibacter sp.]
MKRSLLSIALLLSAPVFAATPVALSPGDVAALVKPPAKGVRLIALWSLDCAYCEENLAALRAYQRQHADVDLVFVATDTIGQASALEARLKAARLDDVPSRAYTDATPDRINFMIDPTWGGETPRTLSIRADGSRKGVSGALDARRIAGLVD